MNIQVSLRRPTAVLTALVVAASLAFTASMSAKGGATDPIPGTSKSALGGGATGGGGGGGGGGGKKSTVVTTPVVTPAPVTQPLVTKTITFTSNTYGGSVPTCTGDYRIDPYYPTLSLMTVTVNVSGANVPDGSNLFLYVNGLGGTLYPFTSNVLAVTSQSGSVVESIYITPGTTIDSILVTDASGVVLSSGL